MSKRDQYTPEADGVGFDPGATTLTSDNTGDAIRELAVTVGVSASPGFSFGRSGNVTAGTWFSTVGGVPSNKAGITVALSNPEVTKVYVANEDISTFDVEVYEHQGNEIGLTLIGTVNVVASRSASFTVSYAVTSGEQLAVKIVNGSAKNCNIGLQLKGNV
jgi:hypothetical protein